VTSFKGGGGRTFEWSREKVISRQRGVSDGSGDRSSRLLKQDGRRGPWRSESIHSKKGGSGIDYVKGPLQNLFLWAGEREGRKQDWWKENKNPCQHGFGGPTQSHVNKKGSS